MNWRRVNGHWWIIELLIYRRLREVHVEGERRGWLPVGDSDSPPDYHTHTPDYHTLNHVHHHQSTIHTIHHTYNSVTYIEPHTIDWTTSSNTRLLYTTYYTPYTIPLTIGHTHTHTRVSIGFVWCKKHTLEDTIECRPCEYWWNMHLNMNLFASVVLPCAA